ncbi:hypothetical protein RSSM_02863 [Rhodopirellula sallentina SM41]|uniref:Uncharacterized protein n=1 Tax=Rhodopirellula sallentina SM41 TaxID=1263870 RepID=M5UCW6_9BACT|nr:hypothetical protein RSSM_02863 [Rhodopirellula sallentina SM41]
MLLELIATKHTYDSNPGLRCSFRVVRVFRGLKSGVGWCGS